MKNYILNLETGKIELHFEKSEYDALTDAQKKELKSAFLWSKYSKAWVSRSINNHWRAEEVAKKLGFEGEERTGERLSYAEQLERKAEKAEARAERMETHAENAARRAGGLQKELNSYHGDIAFFTQPNINSSSGRAFTNYRNRVYARYEKGFEEYRKSEYFKDRAETARATADMKQLKSPVYLDNRIKECNSSIKKLQANIVGYEEQIHRIENGEELMSYFTGKPLTVEIYENCIKETLEKMEYELDKLAFFENCMEEVKKALEAVGRKVYSKEDIKPGYLIKVRGRWAKVLKANPKTVEGDYLEEHLKGCYCLYPYAEIQDLKIPEGWTDKNQEIENPFEVGDILARSSISGTRIIAAFQVVKKSNKTIEIQEIKIEDNKPIQNDFISNKQERRTVKKTRDGAFVVNDGNWYLYKYEQNKIAGAV